MASQPRLLLVGTVHLAPQGEEQLLALLHQVRPACITVEVSRYGLLFRQRQAPALIARLDAVGAQHAAASEALAALRQQLLPPFEWRAAQRYCAEAPEGVLAVPADLSSISHELLTELVEACEPENLEQLVEDDFRLTRSHIEQVLLARKYLRDAHLFPWHLRPAERDQLARRGAQLARVIAGHLARVAPRPLVHVGGYVHLLQAPEEGLQTLASLLTAQGTPFRSLLLGDRLPPPFAPAEAAEPADEEPAVPLRPLAEVGDLLD
ncbi:MAG: hypothetical protein RBU45_20215 [Myxococcota bacterium]|nr:hypothetical protein [Myxococcota bacterium]